MYNCLYRDRLEILLCEAKFQFASLPFTPNEAPRKPPFALYRIVCIGNNLICQYTQSRICSR